MRAICRSRLLGTRYSVLSTQYSALSTPYSAIKSFIVSVNLAAFHYKTHSPQSRDVVRRISLDSDQICEQSSLNLANLIFHVQHTRIDGSCRTQRFDDRHAPAHHGFDFSRVVTMSEDAHVAAAGNGHTRFKRLFENQLLTLAVRTRD